MTEFKMQMGGKVGWEGKFIKIKSRALFTDAVDNTDKRSRTP